MPWRGLFVVTAGLLTSGCILSAYQIASWTATGVSYAFSGKGLGDHALSLATSQDCATLRILQGKQVCVDYGSDFENSWQAMASTWQVPDLLRAPEETADSGTAETPVVVATFNEEPVDIAPRSDGTLAAQAAALTVRLEPASKTTREPEAGLNFDGLLDPAVSADTEPETPWIVSSPGKPAIDLAGSFTMLEKPAAVRETSFAAKQPAPEANPPILRKVAAITGETAIYLVLGSFSDSENARALKARHADRPISVQKTDADGKSLYRVMAGPIDAADLGKARMELARAGLRNAWAVKLCSDTLLAPPCEPVVQEAFLPAR